MRGTHPSATLKQKPAELIHPSHGSWAAPVRCRQLLSALLALLWTADASAQQTGEAQASLPPEPPTMGQPVPEPARPRAPPSPAREEKKAEPSRLVELYGKVYPEMVAPTSGLWHPSILSSGTATPADSPVATFAAEPTGTRSIQREIEFASSNSKFGLRGHQRFGEETKAIFQLETLFGIHGGSTTFGTLDSFVGISNKRFGTVKLGRFNTPFKEYGDDISFLGVSAGNFTSTSTVLRRPGFGESNASRFHERRANAAQYESPQLFGVELAIQYSSDLAASDTRNPHIWSGGAKWGIGDFEVALAHEIHRDLFGGSRNVPDDDMSNFRDQSVRSTDRATSLMLKYTLGIFAFEFDINDKRYFENSTTPGRFRSYRNNSYMVIWDARWSPQWRTQAHYVGATPGKCSVVDGPCTTDGLEGLQVSAGVAYHFARPTFVFAMATWLRNGPSAQFQGQEFQEVSVGEDLTQYAVGIHHSFELPLIERP
jgi:predicted porin